MVVAVLSAFLLLSIYSRCTVESFRTTTPVVVISVFDPHRLRCHRPPPIVSSIRTTAAATRPRASYTTQRYQSRSSTITAVVDEQERDDVKTIQILMSDTGGGHRASANALRDALRTLPYGDNIQCDIVDLYADYGNIWPYTSYPQLYKLLASYPWSWAIFYWFGTTDLGLAMNDFLLRLACRDTFRQCLARIQPSTGRRADLIVSVHPLTNSLPLEIVRQLDQEDDEKRKRKGRTTDHHHHTPFCTVVTDLGSAHPTWFCDGYVWSLLVFRWFYCRPTHTRVSTHKHCDNGTHTHTNIFIIIASTSVLYPRPSCAKRPRTAGCATTRLSNTGYRSGLDFGPWIMILMVNGAAKRTPNKKMAKSPITPR
jgi:hypothetical protein